MSDPSLDITEDCRKPMRGVCPRCSPPSVTDTTLWLASCAVQVNYTVLAMTALTFVHPAVQVCRVLRKGHDETPAPTPYETQPSIQPEVPPAPCTRKCSNQPRRLSSEL